MKLGIDLHGVVTDLCDVFKFIGESVIKNGGEVHILTGGSIEKSLIELQELGYEEGIHYTHLFSVLDYHLTKGTRITGWHPVFKNAEFPNTEWDKTKADYCRDNDIAIHIDDSMVYNEYFTTPFARLWTKTNTPKINKPKRMLS